MQCSIHIILQKTMIKKSSKAILNRNNNYNLQIERNNDAKRPFPVINKVHFKTCNDDKNEFAQRRSRQSKGSCKKLDFSVQSIQLDQSKWLIFNEEKDDQTRYSTFNSLRKNTITNVKKLICKIKTDQNSLQINLAQPLQQNNTFRPITTVASQKQIKSSNRLKVSRIKNLNMETKQETALQKKPSHRKMEDFKSSRSCKSVKSNKTFKQLVQHSKPEIVREQMKVEAVKEHKEQDRFLLITRLYNQIQLLNSYHIKNYHHLDLYEDYQLAIPKTPKKDTQEVVIKTVQPQIVPRLSVQQNKRTIQVQEEGVAERKQGQIQIIPQIQVNQEQQNWNKHQIVSFQELTTKATQIYTQEKQSQEPAETRPQQRQTLGSGLLQEFKEFIEVRLIRIDHNAQTALFPCKSMPQYIRPIPSTSSLHTVYKNEQMISFLNHLLFCSPKIIHNAFENPSKDGFKCNLYDGKQFKSILVDGIFPFDANFYPLYGHFDHFIWFSVLVKCIAELKGSYIAVNQLQHHHIFELLTGQSLVKCNLNWQESKSLKNLKIIFKQAQAGAIFLTIKYQNIFYQLHKIETSRSLKNKPNRQPSNLSSVAQGNYKALSSFLKKQKKIFEKNELFQNTIISLRGFEGNRRLSYKDLIEQQFEVYTSNTMLVNQI